MKLTSVVTLIFLITATSGCVTLREPEITKRDDIRNYSFVVVPQTASLSSGSGAVYGNQYGIYGSSSAKTINPGDLIEGVLLKRGLISIENVVPEDEDKTLLVRYGESGRREVAGGLLGYTLEVTIVMVSAETNEVVYSCVAEGIGNTEADDIREAIHRCLSGL